MRLSKKSDKYLENRPLQLEQDCFEQQLWQDAKFLCGLDEAGRGCLAGPVVAAAVILPANTKFALLKDSKILSDKQRREAFAWIVQNCWYSFAVADSWAINKFNILEASKLAMLKAFSQLLAAFPHKPELVGGAVVDAVKLDALREHKNLGADFKIWHPCKAESISSSVAAASIVAKVMRDDILIRMSSSFNCYDFAQHKGYGTAAHVAKILSHGASVLHREKFVTTILQKMEQKNNVKTIEQCSIW